MSVAGTTIAHFEIEAEIGRGGMGVVYRARDTILGRTVALKVLLPELMRDPGRRARFLREARTAAAVNHPNVATMYEVGESDETVYLAMEHVDGESLRDLLVRERPAVERAIEIARAIATALAAAHDAKVIHRDLKPGNVLIGRPGEIKLCDFGLAKSVDPDAEPGAPVTRDSAIIGTPAYMSPEQCRGRAVDHRSDLFSFGTLLYELISGRRPFVGDSYPELGIAIMKDPAPPLGAGAPPALARVVERCLEKRPEDRYRDAHELLAALTGISAASAAGVRRWPLLAAGVAAIGLGGWIAIGALAPGSAPPPRDAAPAGEALRERQLTSLPPESRVQTLAASPDGRWFAYATREGLWTAQADGEGAPRRIEIEGFDVVEPMDVSPDGRLLVREWVGDGEIGLGTLDVEGGAVTWLRRMPYQVGRLQGRFSPDGSRIVFYGERGLRVMSATGGDDRLLVPFAGPEGSIAQAWSPDGRYVAFIRDRWTRDGWNSRLEVASADGARISAPPTEGFVNQPGGVHGLAWLAPDRLVYGAADPAGGSALWMMGIRDGEWDGEPQRRLHGWPDAGVDWMWRVGDGLLYVKNTDLGMDVMVTELGSDGALAAEPRRLTEHDGHDLLSDWRREGEVMFVSDRNGAWDLFTQAATGDGPAEALADGPATETGARRAGGVHVFWRIEGTGEGELPRCALYRHDPDGEPIELLVLAHVTRPESAPPYCAHVECAAAVPDRCVLVEDVHGEVVVSLFDPREAVLERRPTKARRGGALSPDGQTLAVVEASPPQLLLVDLESGAETFVPIDLRVLDATVAWRLDRDGWLVTGRDGDRGVLAAIEPTGVTRVLWSRRNLFVQNPRPSPDGRQVAFLTRAIRCDVWRLDGVEP